MKHPRAAAKRRYHDAKYSANKRGYDFLISFDDWDAWWASYGIDKNFPTYQDKNQLCMCRIGDIGPYQLSNIYLGTRSQNTHDRNINIGPYIAYGTYNIRSKPCITPLGRFDNRAQAAIAHNYSPQYMGELLNGNKPDFYYL